MLHSFKLETTQNIKTVANTFIFASSLNAMLQAGYEYDDETFEKVFKRIYSSFGSSAPYSVFLDSQPFLRWARQKGLIVGIVSNAEYRYQDVILPALGLNRVNIILTISLLVLTKKIYLLNSSYFIYSFPLVLCHLLHQASSEYVTKF